MEIKSILCGDAGQALIKTLGKTPKMRRRSHVTYDCFAWGWGGGGLVMTLNTRIKCRREGFILVIYSDRPG